MVLQTLIQQIKPTKNLQILCFSDITCIAGFNYQLITLIQLFHFILDLWISSRGQKFMTLFVNYLQYSENKRGKYEEKNLPLGGKCLKQIQRL